MTKAEGWVYFRNDWWVIVREEPRDMYRIKLGDKERRVSLKQLLKGTDDERED